MTHTAVPTVPGPATMRDRVPAQALIERVLLHRAAARPRTRLDRLVGRDPIDREASAWFAAAGEERAVAARLATLPADWTVLHSLPLGRDGADIDHLIVGPGGVFTVHTTRYTDASVWVAGRTVLVPGARRAVVTKAIAEARRVDRIVADVLVHAPAVRPLIAVVGAKRIATRRGPRAVTVLRVEHLRRFLRAQPERLTPEQLRRLVTALDDPRKWTPTADATPALLIAYSRLAREMRGARGARTAWLLGLLSTTAAASAAIVLPGLVTVLGGH